MALESDNPQRYDALYLTNYAQLHIVNELSRLDGVGGVNAFGAGEYSMRVWMNPEVMQIRGVTPSDVKSAIEAQNMEVSAGSVGSAPTAAPTPFQFTLTSKGRLVTPEQFGNIIVKTDANGSILRLKDIAKVDLGSDSYNSVSRVSGNEAGLIGIYQRSDANALEVAKAVEAELQRLEQYLPEGIHYRILMNTTEFVSASIDACNPAFPTELAGSDNPHDNHPGLAYSHICRDEIAGIHTQHSHLVRACTGNCHSGGRRDSCGGGLLANT